MRIKTRLKQLEKVSKHFLSKKEEFKDGYRVVESEKKSTHFFYTSIGAPYAFFLELDTLELLHKDKLIDSLPDVCGMDMVALAESRGFFKNSEGRWETRPDIEYELIKRFLEEDHKRLGNDLQWIKSLRERLEWLRNQF